MSWIHGRKSQSAYGRILALTLAGIALGFAGCDNDEDNGVDECSVTLAAPNGGEVWTVGDSLEIVWSIGEHCGAYTRVDLMQNGDSCLMLADSLETQSLDWLAARCEGDSGYAIRVTDLVTGRSDLSDSPFVITDIALLESDVREWLAGETMTIAWEAGSACSDQLRIDLLLDGIVCRTLTENAADESFEWVVSRCGDVVDGYAIRITDELTGVTDESDVDFSIRSLIVTCSNGNDYWPPNSQETLTWRANAQCGPTVTIELLRNGILCSTIAAEAPNSGSYDWTVAACGTAQTGYTVRISDASGGYSDESDAPFSITTTIPLSYAISRAGPGEANGHWFERLVDLDPYLSYSGGIRIKSDTCIRGHSARIDLGARNIEVLPDGDVPTRFDIDHCIITNGNIQAAFGGAIEYWPFCSGRVFNNTFFRNQTSGVYLHEEFALADMHIFNNIFYNDAVCGVVRPNEVVTEEVIYFNCSNGHQGDLNFCEHCGCTHDPTPTQIGAAEAGRGNFEANPEFISTDPKTLNLHLRPTSPCIGTGEGGEDLGALPYVPD